MRCCNPPSAFIEITADMSPNKNRTWWFLFSIFTLRVFILASLCCFAASSGYAFCYLERAIVY
jgi:hypothetical protein